jgi:DNA-binding LacI/PurR family transcriptional regulator
MEIPSSKTRFFCSVALLLLSSTATALVGAANSFAYDDGGKKPKIVFVTSAGPGGLGGPQSNRNAVYLRAIAAAGLMPRLVTYGDFSEEDGVRATRLGLSADPRPTALFAANDLMALGAMTAIRKANLTIPDDIALMRFDDIFAARGVTLSTINQFQHELARSCLVENASREIERPVARRAGPDAGDAVRDSQASIRLIALE